jgi:DNA uptake protein ComE-like DNA-binding protein
MWKDFFYFTRGQRTGVIILVTLILMALIVDYCLPYFYSETVKTESAFIAEVKEFKKTLQSRDSVRQALWKLQNEERQLQYEEKYFQLSSEKTTNKTPKYTLFNFDPNKLDSAGFVRLGLRSNIASNILKYRNKGGLFRTKSDFGKVYGIFPEKFNELEPYIFIDLISELKAEENKKEDADFKKIMMVDLNSADTTLLMQVKGIGRGYAKGIVRFRRETGGFVSVDQLNEIYGMRPENFERICTFCYVNMDLVQKIKVNSATTERLNAHPYISFYQAKALYELRRKRGRLKEISELNVLDEFTVESVMKIKPYLSFD